MAEVKFIVKYFTTPADERAWENGLYDDLEQAKKVCQHLIETEADEAWVELFGYPDLHMDSFKKPAPPPPAPVAAAAKKGLFSK